MKIKTPYYAVFYNDRGAWRGPMWSNYYTLKDIQTDYGSVESLLKDARKAVKKRVRLFQQVWSGK